MSLVFDLVLCLMILGTAAASLLMRSALGGIVFFIAFGNLLGIAWLSLGAVNVALAEIAIGAGVTGILLILAHARLSAMGDPVECEPTSPWMRAAVAVICGGLIVLLSVAVLSISPTDRMGAQIATLMPALGIENPVTGVLLAFRAYDTLLETFVLLGALVAVWAIAPPRGWPQRPASLAIATPVSLTVIGTFSRVLLPASLVMAAYLVWTGSDLPGGAFQGGTVLAGGILVAALGGAIALPRADDMRLRSVLVLGPAMFLGIGLGGIALGRFLSYPVGLEKALIVAIEYALALSIGATLALLVAGKPVPPAAVQEGGD
ncbi:MnhB domain-containing protein [Paracoccus sp. MKU1]|uniref:MnhB domain-containing protein n=1 Tax=Paracoccus sp. MKU1 TaxID=1745182 RepID=UPI000719161E|nr:MnhB domain-containing protein [Paracoccus sp. MKU1]